MAEVLPQCGTNYEGCIAQQILDFGEPIGNADKLYDTVAGVAKACLGACAENDPCLLAPPVSWLGLKSFILPNGQPVQENEMEQLLGVRYPAQLDVYRLASSGLTPVCQRTERHDITISADMKPSSGGLSLPTNQKLGARVVVSAFGNPKPPLPPLFSSGLTPEVSGIAKKLESIGGLTVSSWGVPDDPSWKLPFIYGAKVTIGIADEALIVTDEISGIVVSENTPAPHKVFPGHNNSSMPPTAIVLQWPRLRKASIPLTNDSQARVALALG